MQARQYQIDAVNSIYTYFANNSGNPILALPTASGKSVVLAKFLQSVYTRFTSQRVIILTHRSKIIEQNFAKLKQVWHNAPAGIFSAQLKKKQAHYPITFAGIQSVGKKPELFGKVDLIIIDECHLVSPKEETLYASFISALTKVNPHIKAIGLTATPWRLGSGHLTESGLFTDVCFDLTSMEAFNSLLADGYLSHLIPKQTKTVLDVSSVHKVGGEYVAGELERAVDKQAITEAALREVLEQCGDRKHWLIFASGIDHANHISEMLNVMGVPSACVHSKMEEAPDKVLREYESGKYRAIVTKDILTTGFDFPGIDLIVMLRPSASSSLWVQMLGRGTRVVYAKGFDLNTAEGRLAAIQAGPKQNCLVLDFAGNTRRLGPINDPVIPKKKGDKGAGGLPPVKVCEHCGTINHISARFCVNPECGEEFIFKPGIKVEADNVQLIAQELPVIDVLKVDHVSFARHQKQSKPPIMRVTYYCNLEMISEWVCLEHPEGSYSLRKAREWWQQYADGFEYPISVEDALAQTDIFKLPTHIRVWVNKKYPEIMAKCFDGTAFGAEQAIDHVPTRQGPKKSSNPVSFENDDDIPF